MLGSSYRGHATWAISPRCTPSLIVSHGDLDLQPPSPRVATRSQESLAAARRKARRHDHLLAVRRAAISQN